MARGSTNASSTQNVDTRKNRDSEWARAAQCSASMEEVHVFSMFEEVCFLRTARVMIFVCGGHRVSVERATEWMTHGHKQKVCCWKG